MFWRIFREQNTRFSIDKIIFHMIRLGGSDFQLQVLWKINL